MKYINYIFFLVVLISTSCKKENNSSLSGEKVSLKINIKGITDLEPIIPKTASTLNSYHQQLGLHKDTSTINLEQVALEISSETQSLSYDNNVDKIEKLKNKKLATTSSPMDKDITYRLLLYNKTTKRIEHSLLITNGINSTSIPVVNGQEYDYYAYSYNNKEEISDPAESN